MKSIKCFLLVFVLAVSAAFGNVPEYLQSISVTIHAGGSQGSGVIIIRDGKAYVLTAGHVVASCRYMHLSTDPVTQAPQVRVKFQSVIVSQSMTLDDGTEISYLYEADIVRYSDTRLDDLALLKIRGKTMFDGVSTVFAQDAPPKVGTEVYHCGSLFGQEFYNSVTSGIYSFRGRVFNNKVYDQLSCSIRPGSSGGGVFALDGQYLGMVVMANGETIDLIVPVRRIHTWATRVGLEFLFDKSLPAKDVGDIEESAAFGNIQVIGI